MILVSSTNPCCLSITVGNKLWEGFYGTVAKSRFLNFGSCIRSACTSRTCVQVMTNKRRCYPASQRGLCPIRSDIALSAPGSLFLERECKQGRCLLETKQWDNKNCEAAGTTSRFSQYCTSAKWQCPSGKQTSSTAARQTCFFFAVRCLRATKVAGGALQSAEWVKRRTS